jgi:hypothetical protein
MRIIRDFAVCLVTGLALFWLFFVVGLDIHCESTERPPWSKPSAVEVAK